MNIFDNCINKEYNKIIVNEIKKAVYYDPPGDAHG